MKKIFMLSASFLIIAEILFRLFGFAPYEKSELAYIQCEPRNWVSDSIIGFINNQGTTNCNVRGLNFTVNIQNDLSRATSMIKTVYSSNPQIHIYGCSITWGHGLDDDATMAWMLQEQLPQFEVKNFGIGAGSTVQSYLWLKKNIEHGNIPTLVMVNYTWFHNMRNTFSWPWREVWQSVFHHEIIDENQVNNNFNIPIAKKEADTLKIDYISKDEIESNIPLVEYSALLNIINDFYQSKLVDRGVDDYIISQQLLLKMNDLCKQNNITFIVNAVTDDAETTRMLEFLNDKGILTNNIAVDFLNDDNYNLKPYDGHPNRKANEHFANEIIKFLKLQ